MGAKRHQYLTIRDSGQMRHTIQTTVTKLSPFPLSTRQKFHHFSSHPKCERKTKNSGSQDKNSCLFFTSLGINQTTFTLQNINQTTLHSHYLI